MMAQTQQQQHEDTRVSIAQEADAPGSQAQAAPRQADGAKQAEIITELRRQLKDALAGSEWKSRFEAEHEAFEAFRAEVRRRDTLSRVRAAYRGLLDKHDIDRQDADLILAATDFSGMKLTKDGALEDEEKLTADIRSLYARYIPTQRTRGAQVETPPPGRAGAFESMSLADKMAFANAHPNDAQLSAWLRS